MLEISLLCCRAQEAAVGQSEWTAWGRTRAGAGIGLGALADGSTFLPPHARQLFLLLAEDSPEAMLKALMFATESARDAVIARARAVGSTAVTRRSAPSPTPSADRGRGDPDREAREDAVRTSLLLWRPVVVAKLAV